MSKEYENSPIHIMAEALANMTTRAINAERQLADALSSSDYWREKWQEKDRQLTKIEAKLAAEIKEHQNTQQALREALDNCKKKGATKK